MSDGNSVMSSGECPVSRNETVLDAAECAIADRHCNAFRYVRSDDLSQRVLVILFLMLGPIQ